MADLEAGPLDQNTEKLKIRKQLRFIRDLYSKFPTVVVAGGCPMNHNYGVAAKDIDIFVTSPEIAQAVLAAYPVVSYQLLGDSTTAAQQETYAQTGYINEVHEAFIQFGGRPKYTLHLNVIVLRDVPATATSRLALAQYVTGNFPLPVCKVYYAEVYKTLSLCRPYSPVPMYSPLGTRSSASDQAYKERILRKSLLLASQQWNLQSYSPYKPAISNILVSPIAASQYGVASLMTMFRNYDFKTVTRADNLAVYPSSLYVLRDVSAISGYELLNLIGENDYATANRLYEEKRQAFNNRTVASGSTLYGQAASLVSAMLSEHAVSSTVSRPFPSDWVS